MVIFSFKCTIPFFSCSRVPQGLQMMPNYGFPFGGHMMDPNMLAFQHLAMMNQQAAMMSGMMMYRPGPECPPGMAMLPGGFPMMSQFLHPSPHLLAQFEPEIPLSHAPLVDERKKDIPHKEKVSSNEKYSCNDF